MVGNPIVTLVCWALYFGLTVGIILLDRTIQQKRAAAQGSVDFMDRTFAVAFVLTLALNAT